MRCHVITSVWGEWHVKAFTSMNLPSLLAAGNLPGLARTAAVELRVHTSRSDAAVIENAPAMQALRRLIPVQVAVLDDEAFRAPIETHIRLWRESVAAARDDGAFAVMNPPDVVWADGSFAHLGRRLSAGARAVYLFYLRVAEETFGPALAERAAVRVGAEDAAALAVAPRDLAALGLQHFHPLQACYHRSSRRMPHHMEYIGWPVGDEGVLVRAFAGNIFCFDPRLCDVNELFSIDHAGDPADVAFIEDSDDMFGVSLTPLLKDRAWYFQERGLNVEDLALWWLNYASAVNDRLVRRAFRFHRGAPDGPAWRRAEQESAFLVNQAICARETIHIGRILTRAGLHRASQLLATALVGERLRRRLPVNGPVTLFCPTDQAFDAAGPDVFGRLLAAGNGAALLQAVRRHVVAGTAPVPGAPGESVEIRSMAGAKILFNRDDGGLRVDGRRASHCMDLPFGHRLYAIDGVL